MKLNKFSFSLAMLGAMLGAIILAIPLYLFNVNADQGAVYQIKILEISVDGADAGSYALHSALAKQDNISVDTIPMKEFVTQPDDLNGKYDAIYIGKGTLTHDITLLKADEIIKEYINKGLPLILHKDVLDQVANNTNPLKDQSVLYKSFYKYSTATDRTTNVLFVDDAELVTLISQIKNSPSNILEMLQQRPRISMDSENKLIDYSNNTNHSYKAGDKLIFPFQTHHIQSINNKHIQASLYMSNDKVPIPTEENLVTTKKITGPANEIGYTLPKAYSGLLYWKLVVSDQQSGLQDYITGTIRYTDEKPVIRILQVLPTDDVNTNLTKVLEPSLLESDRYKLEITAVSFTDFNTIYAKQLNGNYDTLIFGSQDENNKYGLLSAASTAQVQQFITTGQSVLFNDGTLFTEPIHSSATSTSYPFDLSKDSTIQTYSKSNISSADTAHTNTTFTNSGKKLFINTIYQSFMGANHAPEITVDADPNNSVKPSYLNNLMVSYTVNDWDSKDALSTSVKFKHNGAYLPMEEDYANKSTRSGDMISQSFNNPLPDGGDLQIEISAKDARGAQTIEVMNLTIQNVTANLETNRTLSSKYIDNQIPVGKDITITYSITPKNIPVPSGNKNEKPKDKYVISDLTYLEHFPKNLKVSGEDITTTGDPSSGMTVNKMFKDITYQLSDDKKTYITDANQSVTFKLTVTPTVKGVYNLVSSDLAYRDIHAISKDSSLGIAGNYSAFMLDKLVGMANFSSQGRIAARNKIHIGSGFSIGTEFRKVEGIPYDDVLISGGDLIIESNGGQVHGNALYAGKVHGNTTYIDEKGKIDYGIFNNITPSAILGNTRHEQAIDFTTTDAQLVSLSSSLAQLDNIGHIKVDKYNKNEISLVGTNTSLNVFNVLGTDISNASGLHIKAPIESTVIVNFDGSALTLPNFGIFLTGGITSNHILYNFSQATTLDIKGLQIEGSVLAPKATLTLEGGNINGNYIGKSFISKVGGYQFYQNPFTGTLPNPIPIPIPPGEIKKVSFPPVKFDAIEVTVSIEGDHAVNVGSTIILTAISNPTDANIEDFVWRFKNKDNNATSPYATIEKIGNGKSIKLTGIQAVNNITITVTAGGSSASHDVKISSTLTGLQFSDNEIEIDIGESFNLNLTLWPIPRSYPIHQITNELQWSFYQSVGGSSGTGNSIISLDNKGNVIGLKKGYQLVNVTYSKSSTGQPITATIKVIVVNKVSSEDKY